MKKSLLLVSIILLLLGSISCQLLTPSLATDTGTLDLTILYTGQWYRETFNYQPDAPNIRHIAFVLPSEVAFEKEAGWMFTSLEFTPSPEPLKLNERGDIFEPMLEYLHDAPQGQTVIELPPGTYRLAVAFIAAALPPPDNDAILYPGVTGGGVSNEFQEIMIEAGKTLTLQIELTDENGWGYVGGFVSR
jgi:hypothetical protein